MTSKDKATCQGEQHVAVIFVGEAFYRAKAPRASMAKPAIGAKPAAPAVTTEGVVGAVVEALEVGICVVCWPVATGTVPAGGTVPVGCWEGSEDAGAEEDVPPPASAFLQTS